VRDRGGPALVGDALADPSLLLPSLMGGALPVRDLWRMLQLRRAAMALSVTSCFEPRYARLSTRDFLRAWGFSARTIDGFFAPFYGGILLDRSLSTRASVLLFTFKMLAEGRTAVPAAGMGAIPAQLAAQLPAGTVRTATRVRALLVEQDSGVWRRARRWHGDPRALWCWPPICSPRTRSPHGGVTLPEPRSVLGCTTCTTRPTRRCCRARRCG
jgi:hypothetical protein